MTKVKFCENNFKHGSKEVAQQIKDSSESASVEVQPCLGYCVECALQPLAKIGDEVILAQDKDDLHNKIQDKL